MFNKLFKKQQPGSDNAAIVESICALVRDLIDEEFRSQPITSETKLADLGFDSIKYIHLLLSLEDQVGMDLEQIVAEIDLTQIQTIGDIAAFLNRLKEKH